MAKTEPQRVAARYIGTGGYTLKRELGPYYDGNDNRLNKLTLEPGDILMLPETEVNGQTYLFDARGEANPRYLGAGRVVLPKHQELSPDDLSGTLEDENGHPCFYQFHEGRADFEPVETRKPTRSKTAEKTEQPVAPPPSA